MNRKKANDNLIGEAIKRNRLHAKMTAKNLGLMIGFSENTAETRIGQYECGVRIPSPATAEALAKVLGISKYALMPVDISTDEGMFNAIVKIMSVYDVRIGKLGDNYCLLFPNTDNMVSHYLKYLHTANNMYRDGKITADDYLFVADGVDIHIQPEAIETAVSLQREMPRNIGTDFYELLSVVIPDGVIVKDSESFFVEALSMLNSMLLNAAETAESDVEDLMGELLEKMLDEQGEWLDEIEKLPPDEIVQNANIISVREEIIYRVENDNFLSFEQIQALLNLEKPLEACFEYWTMHKNNDENAEFYEGLIRDCADEVQHG